MRENEGVDARVLLDFDADAEKIRNRVAGMLSGPGPIGEGGYAVGMPGERDEPAQPQLCEGDVFGLVGSRPARPAASELDTTTPNFAKA